MQATLKRSASFWLGRTGSGVAHPVLPVHSFSTPLQCCCLYTASLTVGGLAGKSRDQEMGDDSDDDENFQNSQSTKFWNRGHEYQTNLDQGSLRCLSHRRGTHCTEHMQLLQPVHVNLRRRGQRTLCDEQHMHNLRWSRC